MRSSLDTEIVPNLQTKSDLGAELSGEQMTVHSVQSTPRPKLYKTGESSMDDLDIGDWAHLPGYRLGPTVARALRIVGSGSEFFPPETIHIDVDSTPFLLPEIIRAVEQYLEEESRRRRTTHWDGTTARLLDFRWSPVDGTEQKHLYLTLGPLSWVDSLIVHRILVERMLSTGAIQNVVNLADISQGNLKDVALANIFPTATVLLSCDGGLLYIKRGETVATPHKFAAIGENLHPQKDLFLSPERFQQMDLLPPFNAVRRGISEEISSHLTVHPGAVILLGISFNLDFFYPSMLFAAAVPLSAAEIHRIHVEYPGIDYHEGKLQVVPADRESPEIVEALRSGDWDEAGRACVIRTLEFLGTVQIKHNISTIELIKGLASGQSSWINTEH